MSNSTDSSSTTTVSSTDSTSVSSTVVAETSTVTSGSTSFITTTESTSYSTITSSVSLSPSTTTVAPSTTKKTTTSSVVEVTSYITESATSNGSAVATVVTITSTAPQTNPTTSSTSESASASSSQPSSLSASGADSSSSSSGLSSGGKIAIAVVIPLVAIALACIFGLFFYKKRQKRKSEEAMRQKEMAEYGFNPNNNPSLAPVGAAYADNGSESEENSGYRGWGNTSTTQRKPSTTMGSGSRGPIGMAMSESSSNQGGYGYQGQGSEHLSGDTVTNSTGIAAGAAGAAGIGALGGAAAARRRSQTDINREPSNASSAYSTGHAFSENSDDIHGGGAVPGPYYHEEVPYNIYNEQQPSWGHYADGRAGGQPVIQNVGARRDTRIERVPTFPQQQSGNAGIAQNF